MNLRETVAKTMISYGLAADALVIVGVSGGTDSLALMHILASLRGSLALRLHIATLDHGLRGEDGAADAHFVLETAQAWNLSVTTGQADVRALTEAQKIGIEAAARIARYDFFAAVAHEVGATHVAVAHNADDQIETVLLHLLRGTGVAGLAGMSRAAPMAGHADLTLIRPLLDLPRADLEAYCREQGLQPRHDASNDDIAYTRNRLRHEVIPYLHEVTPQIRRNLKQLAEIAAQDDDFIDSALHAAIDTHFKRGERRISLPNEIFFNLHPALQKRFIVWAARWCDPASEVSYERVNAALEMALRGQLGARTQFRGDVQLRNDYRDVVVERVSAPPVENLPLLPDKFEIIVNFPGITEISSEWALETSMTPLESDSARLAVAEGTTIVLRGRRSGDHFAPLGLSGHTKKLTEWMIDHKTPRHLREALPLLVVDGEVAAVAWHGWTVSAKFAVRAGSRGIVYFRFASRKI